MATFENREMQQRHNESHPEGKMKAAEHEAEGEKESMRDVVDEHGPATKMEIHTTHEDGHKHKSVHHDHESAKEHVAHAFGEEPEEGEAEPFAGQETPEEEEAEGHMRIPTMR